MRYILDIDETGIPRLKGFNEDLAVKMANELELINKMIGAQNGERASHALTKVNERMSALRSQVAELQQQVTTLRAEAHAWETLNHARGRQMREVFGFNSSMKYEEFLEKLTVLGKAYQDAKRTVEENTLSLKKLQDLQHQFAPYLAPGPIRLDRPSIVFRGN